MIEITSIYSLWWLIPVLLLSMLLSAVLYFRNPKEEFSKAVSILLASFRFVVFSVLGFLLLSPLMISWQTEIEKAKIIILTDDSKSMILSGDSTKLIKYNNSIIDKLNGGLSSNFELINYNIGNSIEKRDNKNNFARLRTYLSGAFTTISEKYKYSNIGAIVLLSDGIYNVGNNPAYASKYSQFPIYTLGFGDTIVHHDISIDKVLVNKTVFIKNKFPVEVSLSAKMLSGYKSSLIISSNGKTIHKKEIVFNGDNDFQKHLFYIEEKEAGLKSYKVYIKSINNERNTLNNVSYANIDVLGSKKKVLLLYSSPHPDVATLQQSLQSSEEYELEMYNYKKFKANVKDYTMVILHQTPDNSVKSATVINNIRNAGIPALWIIGANSGVHYFNAFNTGINIKYKKQSFVETTSTVNNDFSEFILPDEFISQISMFPPLYSPYGQYKTSNSVRSILYQRIGSVATKNPQVCISENSGKRSAFIFGEGIWRWRMYDFMENNSHDNFDGFILKLVRYISLQKTNKRFDLQWESQYKEFDDVVFNAQFYNASYEVVNDADVDLKISNNDGKEYQYSLSNDGNNYSVSAGRLPNGIYTFIAKVDYNKKSFVKRGKFSVQAVELEGDNLLANHDLLRKIAFNSGAKFYPSDEYSKLIDEINNKKDIVNIESQSIQYKDLINYPLLLVFIILLMSVEWFVRKQMGSY